jgi:dTDP-4-dehydrorhamnose reductase
VISGTHPNFVATMLRLVAERDVAVVNDQQGCPTVASDLAAAVLGAVDAGVTGMLHLTNRGATTWFELARTAVAEAGLAPTRITPCTTAEYPTPARRPAYSVLASERAEGLGLQALPEWRESLPGVVASLVERT